MDQLIDEVMGISTFDELKAIFQDQGIQRFHVVFLASNQDNSKNQIVLPDDFVSEISGHGELVELGPSTSTQKTHSKPGKKNFGERIPFNWIDRDGHIYSAPHTKLITYIQYSGKGEHRLSGFVRGSEWAPEGVKDRGRTFEKFGRRLLVLGVNPVREICGLLLTEAGDQIFDRWVELTALPLHSVSSKVRTFDAEGKTREALWPNLKAVCGKSHQNQVLKPGDDQPILKTGKPANNAGGLTLEALLGIHQNSRNQGGDWGSIEIKSYSSSSLSLMTPSADEGPISHMRQFLEQYGWPPQKGTGEKVFSGRLYANSDPKYLPKSSPVICCELVTVGFKADDPDEVFGPKIANNGLSVDLLENNSARDKNLLGRWTANLYAKWVKKHNEVVYVKYERKGQNFKYANKIFYCRGTTAIKFLKALASGIIFYDPGHKLSKDEVKDRTQWRMSSAKTKIGSNLRALYNEVWEFDLASDNPEELMRE